MSYTVYRDQHCTVTHRVRGYRLRGGGGGTGAVKGLKEEKMVSSGSVQLEGPSQKTPHHKTRVRHRGNPQKSTSLYGLDPAHPTRGALQGMFVLRPTPSRCLLSYWSHRSARSVATKQKNVFKCPGYNGRKVVPYSSVKQESHVGASAGEAHGRTSAWVKITRVWESLAWFEYVSELDPDQDCC